MAARSLLELQALGPLRPRTVRLLLATLLLSSAGLRVWHALPDPGPSRFWDERYGLRNIELLLQGETRPADGFHPALSHLPAGVVIVGTHWLHEMTGVDALAVYQPGGGFTPTAYRICRLLQVAFATLGLWLVFLIGRRLGGDRLGLMAAFLLSVVPWHIRQSVVFKADIVLVLAVLLAFYLSLRAVDRGSFASFATAGAGIGLAMASKFNGGPIAIPLALGAFVGGYRPKRAFLLLGCAALGSVATFLILNPYFLLDFGVYRQSMEQTLQIYESKGARAGVDSRFYLPVHAVQTLLSTQLHGALIGTLALAGLATLGVLSLRHLERSRTARDWLMVVSYVPAYVGLYALATPNPDPHNWLPLSPFASLAAAWMLLALWSGTRHLLPASRRSLLGSLATIVLVLALLRPALRHTYRATLPTTANQALGLLSDRLSRPPGRLVVSEHDFTRVSWHRRGWLALEGLPDFARVPIRRLNRADAEVFPAARLEGPAAHLYRRRLEQAGPANVSTVAPRLFETWGPPLTVVLHPLVPVGEPQPGEWIQSPTDRSLYTGLLPPVDDPRRLVSLEYRVHGSRLGAGEIRLAEERLPTVAYLDTRYKWHQTTPRFRYLPEVELRLSRDGRDERIPFTMRQWKRPSKPG